MTVLPQIVVGTYEEFVLGYSPKYEDEGNGKCKLTQTFATHSHQASVRCVAAHNNLMASSGADEYINIYDMLAMEVSTVINYHNSTVTCLEFTPDGTHLVTANQDGDIAIFRCRDWVLVKLWKEAHKHANGVTSLNVHPSGSLLMTTGADNIVRFWNLVKGRQAYATNFSKKCSVGNSVNFGIWSKNGDYYAVCVGNKIEIYATEKAAIVYEINTKTKITCGAFTKKNLFCLGTEEGSLEVHCIKKKKLLVQDQSHKSRVKSLASFELSVYKNDKHILQNYLVSVDSKGGIKLWYLRKRKENYSMELKGGAECDCRITSLALVTTNVKAEEGNSLKAVNSSNNVIEEVTECQEENNPENEKQINSLKKKIKNKNKQPKEKIIENGNSSTPQINKKSRPKIPSTEPRPALNGEENNAAKRKKRTFSETDIRDKQKKSKSSPSSVKKFKKKKLSFSSDKTPSKRMSGKWLVENDS